MPIRAGRVDHFAALRTPGAAYASQPPERTPLQLVQPCLIIQSACFPLRCYPRNACAFRDKRCAVETVEALHRASPCGRADRHASMYPSRPGPCIGPATRGLADLEADSLPRCDRADRGHGVRAQRDCLQTVAGANGGCRTGECYRCCDVACRINLPCYGDGLRDTYVAGEGSVLRAIKCYCGIQAARHEGQTAG